MDTNNLNDYQAELLIEMRLTFQPEDWEKLDKIYCSPATILEKTFRMELLLLQAHNRYVREHGKEPNAGYDEDLETMFDF